MKYNSIIILSIYLKIIFLERKVQNIWENKEDEEECSRIKL